MLTKSKDVNTLDNYDAYKLYYKTCLREYALSFLKLSSYFEVNKKLEPGTDRQKVINMKERLEEQHIIGDYLREVGGIIEEIASIEEESIAIGPNLRKKLVKALREERIKLEKSFFIKELRGNQGIAMELYSDKKIDKESICSIVSEVFGKKYYLRNDYGSKELENWYYFFESPMFIAIPGYAKATKEGEKISGDTFSFYDYDAERMSVLLSDGTGSGETAKEYSELAVTMLEDMLYCGYKEEVAARLVNSFFLAKGEDDNHPTLDICRINLVEGTCSCLKVGGTATFIKSRDNVRKIFTSSLPLGIFRNIDDFMEKEELKSGDFVVVMSDGVSDIFAKNDILYEPEEILSSINSVNAGEIAEQMLRRAIFLNKGRIEDDMTVLVVGIWEKRST